MIIHSLIPYFLGEHKSHVHGKIFTPANEVWGKVMFLHLSVSYSVHGGGGMCVCLVSLGTSLRFSDMVHI